MYTIEVCITGTTPLLQHSFPEAQLNTMLEGSTKQTGSTDYSMEWLETMYRTVDGYLYQPASHVEGAMVKAAVSFKIKGKRGKTWKDAIRAYVYASPEQIKHLYQGQPVKAPGPELLRNPTDHLRVDIRRVKVQRAAVARSRLLVNTGWQLAFSLQVADEQVRPDVCKEILQEAGRAVGIGDFRPRYGRFTIDQFEVKPEKPADDSQ
ncbi:hypothetical protein QUF64_09615 [Anaerolineales bacterium HSG6]|nr:hypothetical protein [Anaerolineales bacterium HSG6]